MTPDPGSLDASIQHGGDLGAARLLFPGAPEPFIDLSTGVNPQHYPVPHLAPGVFARLPEPAAIDRLRAAAAKAYGAPSLQHVVAAAGVQMLLPPVATLVAPGRALVLGPTYAEHARVAVLAGHSVSVVRTADEFVDADLAVVVNPNNPDGRIVPKAMLLTLAETLRRRRGLLVVDEAFMEVGPPGVSLADACGQGDAGDNIVVLRSFGKFYGLAGVRLGFAIAAPGIVARLAAALGPWAVSGPAIAVGEAALADAAWAASMRASLDQSARRLDALLTGAGLAIVGGTPLYRLIRTHAANELFHRLGRAGILVRRFVDEPAWLRFGLPHDEPAWARLSAALAVS